MAEQMVPRSKLIAPLTSLRFFAAMAVVLFHSGSSWIATHSAAPIAIVNLLKNGYLGVTFFFVLSGFVLQHVYRGALSSRNDKLHYLKARFARIYPLYILAFLMILPFTFEANWRAIPQIFLLQRWTLTTEVPFSNWNMPAWTLSVELLFYTLFPLLSAFTMRARPTVLFSWVFLIAAFELMTACSSVMSNGLVPEAWMEWVPVPLLRLPEFFLGILVAEGIQRSGATKMRVPPLYVAAALACALCLSTSPFMAGVATMFSALLIYCCAIDKSSLFIRALECRPLVYLGGASYAIYLLQQPVHTALTRAGFPVLIFYPLLLGLSAALFSFYEEPMRRFLRSRRRTGQRGQGALSAVAEQS